MIESIAKVPSTWTLPGEKPTPKHGLKVLGHPTTKSMVQQFVFQALRLYDGVFQIRGGAAEVLRNMCKL